MEKTLIPTEKRFLTWGRYEFGILMWFFFTAGLIFLDRLTIAYLAPLVLADLQLTTIQYGFIGTATMACYAVSAIVVGVLSDRSGYRKKWLIPCIIGAGVFSALGAFTHSFTALIIDRAMVGLFEGPTIALIMAMLSKESSPKNLALNVGIFNCGAALIGGVLGPLLTTQIAAAHDWRMSFLVASIPTFIIGLLMIKFIREVRFEPLESKNPFKAFGELAKYRNILVCLLIAIFVMAGYWTINLYASLYFSTVGGREITSIGYLLSLMSVFGICWTIIVPKVSDVIGRRAALIFWIAICSITPFMLFGAPTSFASVIVYCVIGALPGCVPPIYNLIVPSETLPPNLTSTAVGLILGIGEIFGGAAWPAISGVVAAKSGLQTVMLVGAICFVIAAIISFALKETFTKEKRLALKEAKKAAKAA